MSGEGPGRSDGIINAGLPRLKPASRGSEGDPPRAADPRRPRTQALQPPTGVERRSKERREGAVLGPDDFLPKPSDALDDPAGFSLSALGGGEGRGEVGDSTAVADAHLTLPLRGPLPLPRARAERGEEIVGRQIAIQPPSTL